MRYGIAILLGSVMLGGLTAIGWAVAHFWSSVAAQLIAIGFVALGFCYCIMRCLLSRSYVTTQQVGEWISPFWGPAMFLFAGAIIEEFFGAR